MELSQGVRIGDFILTTRLHQSLSPIRPLINLELRATEFLSNKDHASAAQHPEEDQANQTSPYALEWLFDASLEAMDAGDTNKRQLAELVRNSY